MDNQLDFEQKTDAELIELVLVDQDNFLYVVRRYEKKLFSYIRRISNIPTEDIDDLLQNIFIKVYLNLNDYNKDLKFSSWIYRIAHNEVIDNYRKLKARPQTSELDIDSDHIKELTDDLDLITEIDNKGLREKINQAINNLDIKLREIIVFKFIEEKDYNEISDIIKKPKGTVASRMNKAKKELKKELIKILDIYEE